MIPGMSSFQIMHRSSDFSNIVHEMRLTKFYAVIRLPTVFFLHAPAKSRVV